MNKFLTILMLIGLTTGCASRLPHPELQLISEDTYYDIVEKNSQKKQIYDGMINVLDISATLMTTDTKRAQVDQSARIYQWTPDQYSNEKSKNENELSRNTELFVSFYTPERKHDDLAKGTTKWKIFLDAGGKRYEGKAVKLKSLLAELLVMYPSHSRWGTPYKITFPVSTSLIENASQIKVTFTGPVTSTFIEFK